MCGFGVSNVSSITLSNKNCQKRGPDSTTVSSFHGVEFLHNHLHITGTVVKQPLVKNDIVCVFNGEIYNFKEFGNYGSDGECLIDLYINYGEKFAGLLDGEFAICLIDFAANKIITVTDAFACKPLWYELKDRKFCIASYNSQLSGLGFLNGQKQKANTTRVYNLKKLNLNLIAEYTNFTFDINQHKTDFNDWITAFSQSIQKRISNTTYGMFCGMSSGYDSGAIACELEKQKANFKAFSILNNENQDILNARLKLISRHEAFTLDGNEFQQHKSELKSNCENFSYNDHLMSYDIKKDQASMGLAAICTRANKEKRRIYFSGQGADEIISDYGFGGTKIYKHSSFGGKFPDTLQDFFPWHSFYDGTQIQYLNKEEYVAGHYGIETRYPFLDKNLVQEFLWLTPELKNSKYKSCLDEYLRQNNFPFQPSEKRGFHVVEKGKKVRNI